MILLVKIWSISSVYSASGQKECCDGNITCRIKFEIICQLLVRILRSNYDLSVKIWNHLSVVSNAVDVKA